MAESTPTLANGLEGSPISRSQLVKSSILGMKHFRPRGIGTQLMTVVGKGNRYAWRSYHYYHKKIDWNDTFAFRGCAIEMIVMHAGHALREKGQAQPRSRASINGTVVNSISGRMDQERFITIKRARGVLECV